MVSGDRVENEIEVKKDKEKFGMPCRRSWRRTKEKKKKKRAVICKENLGRIGVGLGPGETRAFKHE